MLIEDQIETKTNGVFYGSRWTFSSGLLLLEVPLANRLGLLVEVIEVPMKPRVLRRRKMAGPTRPSEGNLPAANFWAETEDEIEGGWLLDPMRKRGGRRKEVVL
ncbi:uncharacterized protein A4U43_C08F29480 [Asparagus officinalis]|nr:uncharacterized protein A4U43_C08F29480 [Asparagus officinalis]